MASIWPVSRAMPSGLRRRSIAGGEAESGARRAHWRATPNPRPRCTSLASIEVKKLTTAEHALEKAYEFITAASDAPAAIVEAPSGRRARRHVCEHPGCGKTFHLKSSARKHYEDHRFRRKLAAATPLADQFLARNWPSSGVPWVETSGLPAAPACASSRSSPSSWPSGWKPLFNGGGDKALLKAALVCKIPGCGHRFTTARLLALHLRVGHNHFQIKRMREAEAQGPGAASYSLGGVPATPWLKVGSGDKTRARFVGSYRLVPPFLPPAECPLIQSCARHYWLKKHCPRCQQISQLSKQLGAPTLDGEVAASPETRTTSRAFMPPPPPPPASSILGMPLPPVKFYRRMRVQVSRRGRPVDLDLDSDDFARCPVVSLPQPLLVSCDRDRDRDRGRDWSASVGCGGGEQHLGEQHRDRDRDWANTGEGEEGEREREGVLRTSALGVHVGNYVEDCPDSMSTSLESSGSKGEDVGRGREASVKVRGRVRMKGTTSNAVNATILDCQAVEDDGDGDGDGDDHGYGYDEEGEGSTEGWHLMPSRVENRLRSKEGKRNDRRGHGRLKEWKKEKGKENGSENGSENGVPMRFVAALEDGTGKAWIAARRLWAAKEVVYMGLLSKTGLKAASLDLEQELFLSLKAEYFPLSRVQATCAVTVGRKDDILLKQRRGDLPKFVRFVRHALDVTKGDILVDSEIKLG